MKLGRPGAPKLLEGLLDKFRVRSPEESVRAWPSGSPSVHDMVRRGLLDRHEVMARPLLPLPRPHLYRWSPDRPASAAPDCDRLAWLCEARGRAAPVPTTVYVASERARRVFGGRTVPRLDAQLSHDLNCAALYVKVLRELPRLAPFFVGEDVRKPSHTWPSRKSYPTSCSRTRRASRGSPGSFAAFTPTGNSSNCTATSRLVGSLTCSGDDMQTTAVCSLEDACRFGLTTEELAHLRYFAGRTRDAARKSLERLEGKGERRLLPLWARLKYYVLCRPAGAAAAPQPAAGDAPGPARAHRGPGAELLLHASRAVVRTYTTTEFEDRYAHLCQPGLPCNAYYLDDADGPRLGLLVVDQYSVKGLIKRIHRAIRRALTTRPCRSSET